MRAKPTVLFISLLAATLFSNRIYAQKPGTEVHDTTNLKSSGTTILTTKITVQQLPIVSKIATDYDGGKQKENATQEDKPNVAYAGNYLSFTIKHPMAFLNTKPTDKALVVLYVNGIEMQGIHSDWCSQVTRLQINSGQVTLPDTAVILIRLRRNDTTKAAWNYFYSQTNKSTDHFVTLDASVGWQSMSALPKSTGVQKITIIYYYSLVFWAWLIIYALIMIGFIILAFNTNVLKDMTGIVTDPGAPNYDPKKKGVYSLSLTQLLFWTTLVIGAFIYCLVLTDMTSSLNSSIMLLIGISASTTGIAYAMDSNFASNNPTAPNKQHQNFIRDVLSDGTSFSVQRIQVFAWNLVLGLYFIIYTVNNKTMPEFTTTLLFLAGISSASYLGAKGAENNNAATAAKSNPTTSTTTIV